MTVSPPYWRLSGFYFCYFATLGAWLPYWSLYLDEQGHPPKVIGILLAVTLLTKVVAPWLWGWLADRGGGYLRFVRFGGLMAWVSFLLIFLSDSLGWLLAVLALTAFFWNAVLPQFEVFTLSHLRDRPERYSLVRLWGSVGFIAAVGLLGLFFSAVSIRFLPWVLVLLLGAIWFSSLLLPPSPPRPRQESRRSLATELLRPATLAFLAAAFLIQLSHGPYYTFYSILLEDRGHTRPLIGMLWALGVGSEVLLFLALPRFLGRIDVRLLLFVSALLTALRWAIIAFSAGSLPLLIAAQLLHAASFGAFHAASIERVRSSFRGGLEGRGQALYSALSFGAGGALGAWGSGWLWTPGGQGVFLAAAGCGLLASCLLALLFLGRRGTP